MAFEFTRLFLSTGLFLLEVSNTGIAGVKVFLPFTAVTPPCA